MTGIQSDMTQTISELWEKKEHASDGVWCKKSDNSGEEALRDCFQISDSSSGDRYSPIPLPTDCQIIR